MTNDRRRVIKRKGKRQKNEFCDCSFLLLPFYVPDAYLMLALASLTAAKKNNAVSGMLNTRIIVVA